MRYLHHYEREHDDVDKKRSKNNNGLVKRILSIVCMYGFSPNIKLPHFWIKKKLLE
jgi:hypothetical protein